MGWCKQYTVFQKIEMKTLYFSNDEKNALQLLWQFLRGKVVSYKWEIQYRFHTGMMGGK
jgi:hypothetical protein